MDEEVVAITLGIILGSIAVLIINYLIAKEFYNVAQSKGYYNQKYLWIPFLIGLAGWLLVIALPIKDNNITHQQSKAKKNNTIPKKNNNTMKDEQLTPEQDPDTELLIYKDFLDSGVITQAEFEEKKKQLLDL